MGNRYGRIVRRPAMVAAGLSGAAGTIPVALTVIAVSIALGLAPAPATAEIIPLFVNGSGALTVSGASQSLSDLAMQALRLQVPLNGSASAGGFVDPGQVCIPLIGCTPSLKSGGEVSASLSGSIGLTLGVGIRPNTLNYAVGVSSQALLGTTSDRRGTLQLPSFAAIASHTNYNTTQRDVDVSVGIKSSIVIDGSAEACAVGVCTGIGGNLLDFSVENRNIIKFSTVGANKVGVSVLGSPSLTADTPKTVASLFWLGPPVGFNTDAGFAIGQARLFSEDNTTSGSSDTNVASGFSGGSLLQLAWNVIPFGSIGYSSNLGSGNITAARDLLTADISLTRSDAMATNLKNFVYFDEQVDITSFGSNPFTLSAGARLEVGGFSGLPAIQFGRSGGPGPIHGHLTPVISEV